MKALLWIVAAVALVAGAVVLAMRLSAGYVQIVLPPHRVELSLVLGIAVLLAGFMLTYLILRMILAMVAMPRRMREYRHARRKRKSQASLTDALRDYFSGRYARAEKAAGAAIAHGEQPGLAAMLAARAAHELRAPERRDAYLEQGATHLPDGDIMRIITEADLLLQQRRPADALAVLQAMPQKHTAGLRLELRALQWAKEWEKSITVIDQLEKRKVYDTTQARELRCLAWVEHIKRRAADESALDEVWRKVPEALRRDARVARAAVESCIALNLHDRGAAIIERSLDQTWDSDLAGRYADCSSADTLRQIERAERWLAAHPDDALLLLTLGRLCARQKLWGKARNYIDVSLSVEPTYQAHLACAQLFEQTGDAPAAQKHYRESLNLAIAQLRKRPLTGALRE